MSTPEDRSYVSTDSPITRTEFGHAWRAQDGNTHATVYLGHATFFFDTPQAARAVAAACIVAAEALETFPPPEPEEPEVTL